MQIIVEVGIDPVSYVNEQYQRRVRAPSVCPNCGRAQALEAHGYYWRWVTALCGLVIQIAVRRFCCRHCPVR
jgi:ribosomal protein S27AE